MDGWIVNATAVNPVPSTVSSIAGGSWGTPERPPWGGAMEEVVPALWTRRSRILFMAVIVAHRWSESTKHFIVCQEEPELITPPPPPYIGSGSSAASSVLLQMSGSVVLSCWDHSAPLALHLFPSCLVSSPSSLSFLSHRNVGGSSKHKLGSPSRLMPTCL